MLGCEEPSGSRVSASSKTDVAPFAVRVGADDLVFSYVDAEGVHTTRAIADIPAGSRKQVRVDSLSLAPEERLDPSQVYLADVSQPATDGTFPTRVASRADFEALIDKLAPVPVAAADEVIIYGASWCGACRATAAFFRERGVNFVELDIEKDADAQRAMQAKLKAAGKVGSGIPVIDFRGEIVTGFDRQRLASLIDAQP